MQKNPVAGLNAVINITIMAPTKANAVQREAMINLLQAETSTANIPMKTKALS